MKLPSKIKILHRTYTLTETPVLDVLRDSAWGHIDYMHGAIEVVQAKQPTETLDTVLHEILHGLVRAMNVDFPTKDAEELAVANISTGLVTVLKDNPELVKFINKALE